MLVQAVGGVMRDLSDVVSDLTFYAKEHGYVIQAVMLTPHGTGVVPYYPSQGVTSFGALGRELEQLAYGWGYHLIGFKHYDNVPVTAGKPPRDSEQTLQHCLERYAASQNMKIVRYSWRYGDRNKVNGRGFDGIGDLHNIAIACGYALMDIITEEISMAEEFDWIVGLYLHGAPHLFLREDSRYANLEINYASPVSRFSNAAAASSHCTTDDHFIRRIKKQTVKEQFDRLLAIYSGEGIRNKTAYDEMIKLLKEG